MTIFFDWFFSTLSSIFNLIFSNWLSSLIFLLIIFSSVIHLVILARSSAK